MVILMFNGGYGEEKYIYPRGWKGCLRDSASGSSEPHSEPEVVGNISLEKTKDTKNIYLRLNLGHLCRKDCDSGPHYPSWSKQARIGS